MDKRTKANLEVAKLHNLEATRLYAMRDDETARRHITASYYAIRNDRNGYLRAIARNHTGYNSPIIPFDERWRKEDAKEDDFIIG